MTGILFAGLVLSFDSFAASFALGTSGIVPRRRRQLAIAFGCCDGMASFLGLSMGISLPPWVASWSEWFGPGLICLYALAVICLAWGSRAVAPSKSRSDWWIFLLPLAMSADNLLAQSLFANRSWPIVTGTVVTLISGLASLVGFSVGAWATVAGRRIGSSWGLRWSESLCRGAVMLAVALVLTIF